ncbi:MAG TPA: PAS domain S-box protein [Thiobacillaceae bacterium]|nr:PAS domain S-box protein [Thiobacillaceae bacterium]HNA82334.1 PAS domain S-box protein [Thiobacillaceae bacterium]HNF89250.1 PAS domain S-box protein [Thiobacillaceae bacterium]HNH88455.1 PAS domain S-box protein [Thiobacillaceae bacterium]HNI07239.1 PAS domain S-box protein [Thiobacillaceae bacterium]
MGSASAMSTSVVHLLGVDDGLARTLRHALEPGMKLVSLDGQERLCNAFQEGRRPADAVLLGVDLEEPVRVAQRIHTYDKHVPILILGAPARCAQLKRTLMFSPFLGNEVTTWPVEDVEALPAAIRDAALRRQQRSLQLNTIANAQIRLEKLPLLQPDAGHYLDQLLDNAPVGVLTVDPTGAVLTLNRQAREILGTSEMAALGHPLAALLPRAQQGRLAGFLGRCLERMERLPAEILETGGADDNPRFVEVTPAPLAYRTGQRGVMLILQDVTDRVASERERERAEEALRLHATVLRGFHEISSAPTLCLAEKLHRLLKLGCEQFGLPIGILSHIDGQCFEVLDAVSDHPDYVAGVSKNLEETYCAATVFSGEPVAFEQAAGTEWQSHPTYLRHGLEAYIGMRVQVDGGLYGTLCFASQMPRIKPFSSADRETLKLMSQWVGGELQRERAEALMRKLSGALEQTADSIIITDRERRIEYVNPAFEQLTGYAQEEVVGLKTYFLRSGVHDEKFYAALWETISAGGVYRGVMVNRKKDGSIFHEQKTISPLKDGRGEITHFISTGHDITELVLAEDKERRRRAELAHVARLSTLGEMTSGLAHELNQPLCAITTYAQTCLRILQSGDPEPVQLRYGLEQVVRQAELGGAIFRRLRNFARKGETRRQRVNVREIIDEVAGFIRTEARQQQVGLDLEIGRNLPRVRVDPIQVEQVLLNLARNALDALGGVHEARRRLVIKASRHARRSVKVCISDSGRGCAPETVDRLFEPFFTTKPQGLGVGLGISQSLIEAHGGRLWLAANSEAGATFCFTLPGEETSHDDDESQPRD